MRPRSRARSIRLRSCSRSVTCSAIRRANCPTARSSAPRWPGPWSAIRHPAARRSPAQRRRQAEVRNAAGTSGTAETRRLDRALCDSGLQGGDGARRPHRRPAGWRDRTMRHTRAIYAEPASHRCCAVVRRSHAQSHRGRTPAGRRRRRNSRWRRRRSDFPRAMPPQPAEAAARTAPGIAAFGR